MHMSCSVLVAVLGIALGAGCGSSESASTAEGADSGALLSSFAFGDGGEAVYERLLLRDMVNAYEIVALARIERIRAEPPFVRESDTTRESWQHVSFDYGTLVPIKGPGDLPSSMLGSCCGEVHSTSDDELLYSCEQERLGTEVRVGDTVLAFISAERSLPFYGDGVRGTALFPVADGQVRLLQGVVHRTSELEAVLQDLAVFAAGGDIDWQPEDPQGRDDGETEP